jgi:hypothetical protein
MTMAVGSVAVYGWTFSDPENPVVGDESVVSSDAAGHVMDAILSREGGNLLAWPTWTWVNADQVNVILGEESFTYKTDAADAVNRMTAVQKLYTLLQSVASARYSALVAMADKAVAIAALIDYIVSNASFKEAIATIAANAAGDGLQNGTTHPLAEKTIPVTGGIQ